MVDAKGFSVLSRQHPHPHLTQAVGAVDGEAHEDDISVRVGERPQAVIVFLACCVPQGQLYLTHRASEYLARGPPSHAPPCHLEVL